MHKEAQKFLDQFKELYPNRRILFLFTAGSHFFDLAGPNSDMDFKGVYMPAPEEFLNSQQYLGETKRRFWDKSTGEGNKKGVKNTKDDVDFYLFSYTFFLELLGRGDFNCMEMLHTPQDKILIDSPEMKLLRENRKNFMVNDISAFLGFIKKEYKRYGINIYHYKAQEDLLDFLNKYEPHTRLRDIWKEIEEFGKGNVHIKFTKSRTGNNVYVPSIKLASRLYQNTVTVEYVRKAIRDRLKTYGHRQKSMAASGVEFKGLYHALRLIYEANDLFDYGEFKLPFNKDRHKTLKSIKEGTMPQQEIFDLIDNSIEDLYSRDSMIIPNDKYVQYKVNKILFQLRGEMKLKALMGA